MILEIKEFNKKDVNQAIQFAITGMHFNWYVNNPFFLHLYGRYFWYLESNRAPRSSRLIQAIQLPAYCWLQ